MLPSLVIGAESLGGTRMMQRELVLWAQVLWQKVNKKKKNGEFNQPWWFPSLELNFFKDFFFLCIWVHCSCTDGGEPSCGCWELNFGPVLTLVKSTLLAQSLLAPAQRFIIQKYTVAVFRHARKGHQISLWVVMSHHVVAGIWTQELQKSNQSSYPLSHLSSPNVILIIVALVMVSVHSSIAIHSRGHTWHCLGNQEPDIRYSNNLG